MDLFLKHIADSKPVLGNGVDSKHANGSVGNKEVKNVDNAFTTKRDKYSDFNKAMTESKGDKKGEQNGKDTTAADKTDKKEDQKDAVELLDENKEIDEKKKAEQGIRLYKVPMKPKKVRAEKTNKVNATLHSRTAKDSDDMELGAEASTLKDEKKDEEEEKQKVIEVYSCWPLICARRSVYIPCVLFYVDLSCFLWFHTYRWDIFRCEFFFCNNVIHLQIVKCLMVEHTFKTSFTNICSTTYC